MSDEVIPELDSLEREDGELTDEEPSEAGTPTAGSDLLQERMAAGGTPSVTARSNSSEGEIDRIVEEANRLLAMQSAAPPSVRNMLDTSIISSNFDGEDFMMDNGGLDETTLSQLREAALKSMKVPGARREDGEVSDVSDEPTENRRRKLSDRIQIVHNSPEFHRRRYSPLVSPPRSRNTARFDSESSRKNKGKRSRRRERTPPDSYAQYRHTKDKDYRRSPYRKRRKSRERRSSVPDNVSTISNDSHHEPYRPRGVRSEAERMSIVLGAPIASSSHFDDLPPPPPPPILGDTSRDNFEVVAMDLDTSSGECSRPPTAPAQPPMVRHRQVSEGDEAQLRNVLLLQLQKKGNTPTRQVREELGNAVVVAPEPLEIERPASIEFIQSCIPSGGTFATSTPVRVKTEFLPPGDDAGYQLNKTKLASLDRVIQTRMHQMEKTSEEKEKLMRKLDEIIGQMTLYEKEYWAATEERDRLRPLVESYEAERIRRLNDINSLRMFTSRMSQHSDNLQAMAATPLNRTISSAGTSLAGDVPPRESQKPTSVVHIPLENADPASVEAPPSVTVTNPPPPVAASPVASVATDPVEALPVETPASPSPSVRDEPMREAPVVPQEPAMGDSRNAMEVEEEVQMVSSSHEGEEKEMRLRAVLLEKLKKKKADSAALALALAPLPRPEVQDDPEEADEYLDEDGPDEIAVQRADAERRLGAIHNHQEHVRRVYQSHNLPLRLLPHAGVPLPNDYEREICHFELNGKCKDYSCEYMHYNDHKMSLRELMSMILFFAPELSDGAQREDHSTQLDRVLSWQTQGEEREQFVRRMLRRLPQTRNDMDARMADVNGGRNGRL